MDGIKPMMAIIVRAEEEPTGSASCLRELFAAVIQ
jgi:hypothetical protein